MTAVIEQAYEPAVGDWISYDRERYQPKDHRVTALSESGMSGTLGCGIRLNYAGIGGLAFDEIRRSTGTRERCCSCAAREPAAHTGTAQLVEELKPYRVTYRMLDHWIRTGVVKGGTPGQGNMRSLPKAEADVARRIALLRHLGFDLDRAAQYARVAPDAGPVWSVPLLAGTSTGPSVTLVVVQP